jgi:hypothetical protein
MVLHVETQNRIFDLFYDRYLEAVEAAKRQSAFDFGVEEIRARNLYRVAEPQTLFVDAASGARTMLHELEGEVDVMRNSFRSAADAARLGFYRNERSGRIYAVSAHWDSRRTEVLLTAVKGARRVLERHELESKFQQVEDTKAREWWEAEYANTPAAEPRRFYILSGAIFPIYDKIMGASGIQSVKIARAVLADGQALVGLNLSPADVPSVKQRLGIGTQLADAEPEEILALITDGGLIELDNGWRVSRARLAGDEILELTINGVPANREELLDYGLLEEIIHFKRRWFVLLENASSVLSRLLAHRRPIRDLTDKQESSVVMRQE